MAYTPDPTDPTTPTLDVYSGYMAAEFQALKGYIQSLIAAGTNFNYMGSLRNRLINGNFEIIERNNVGVVGAASTAYSIDRWQITNTGAGAVNWAQETGSLQGYKYLHLTPAAGLTTLTFSQKIEARNCEDFVSGTVVTISGSYFTSSISAAQPTITLLAANAADNFAATTVVGTGALNLIPYQAATWMSFTTHITLTGNALNGLQFNLNWDSSVATINVYVGKLQLEKGSLATPFEYRTIAIENILCKRYYRRVDVVMAFTGLLGNIFTNSGEFAPAMRASPSVSYVDTALVNCAHNFQNVSSFGWSVNIVTTVAGNIVGNFSILFDAEL